MIPYKVQLNQGVEAFGTTKTITANEFIKTAENRELAREIHHLNGLIPENLAQMVLDNLLEAAAEIMTEGKAVVLTYKGKACVRLYPDVHIKGGNINLARAQQLDPTVTELTLANAGDLATKAGVTVRARAEVEQPMTDLLKEKGVNIEREGVEEKAYIARKDNSGNQGGNGSGSGNDNNQEMG